ncbi:hypothetical protein B0J14DRAFT_691375 [Halenospora varia]|nr:hypothetical protein B0J14DRAFT_691375 [Halenospora varia]
MAFRQPTFHTPQRIYTAPNNTQTHEQPSPLAQPSQQLADSQEWILFSPSAASTTDRGYTNSTVRTRTVGRSRISDFGSLDTAARSYGYGLDEGSEQTEDAGEDEEDGELDSLDSHLYEFGQEPSVYRESAGMRESGEDSGTVLPTHDGLGSFRVDQTLMGEDVQEQLYAFERYNPRRIKRRRESVELGMLELENERAAEAERTRRIEKWRMEQSRLLVDEIQKETRRRKQSLSSERRPVFEAREREQEDAATLSNVGSTAYQEDEVTSDENESFWNRITKRVIRDLMGIDDDLLQILFGEAMPEDDDLSATPPGNRPLDPATRLIAAKQLDQSSWEYRLLERIARELGLLVNQLSDHPGAFSTYLHSQNIPLPYAGLPVIPETARDQSPLKLEPEPQVYTSTISGPEFQPTLLQTTQPLPISSTSLAHASPQEEADSTPRAKQTLSRKEWEQDLDLRMVFRYLRSRITSKFNGQSAAASSNPITFSTTGTSHLATASTADSAARAARVRQHHPLVSHQPKTRRKSIDRRTYRPTVPGIDGVLAGGVGVRRGSSSCASVSGKRNSGSSRHYWDFGAGQSVGSGSLIASTGGMGSWGEV